MSIGQVFNTLSAWLLNGLNPLYGCVSIKLIQRFDTDSSISGIVLEVIALKEINYQCKR